MGDIAVDTVVLHSDPLSRPMELLGNSGVHGLAVSSGNYPQQWETALTRVIPIPRDPLMASNCHVGIRRPQCGKTLKGLFDLQSSV